VKQRLRAGIAVYNEGDYHAAHDAWEDTWLDLPDGSDDERLLHGLIQFTAAVHHARSRNWSGATGLATSAVEYLEPLPADHRGVNVGAVRRYLRALAADPETIERARPLALSHRGAMLQVADLDVPERGVAARVLAEEYGYDESVVADAARYAREEATGEGEGRSGSRRFIALVTDFATEADRRGLVYQRLEGLVERRRSKESDVEGLF